jgi:hypothetical protein
MNDERRQFLLCRHLPARLNALEASWYLGFGENDIPVLASQGFLKPVGDPSQSSIKYFALKDLKKNHEDVRWINRATAVLNRFWRIKNSSRNK